MGLEATLSIVFEVNNSGPKYYTAVIVCSLEEVEFPHIEEELQIGDCIQIHRTVNKKVVYYEKESDCHGIKVSLQNGRIEVEDAAHIFMSKDTLLAECRMFGADKGKRLYIPIPRKFHKDEVYDTVRKIKVKRTNESERNFYSNKGLNNMNSRWIVSAISKAAVSTSEGEGSSQTNEMERKDNAPEGGSSSRAQNQPRSSPAPSTPIKADISPQASPNNPQSPSVLEMKQRSSPTSNQQRSRSRLDNFPPPLRSQNEQESRYRQRSLSSHRADSGNTRATLQRQWSGSNSSLNQSPCVLEMNQRSSPNSNQLRSPSRLESFSAPLRSQNEQESRYRQRSLSSHRADSGNSRATLQRQTQGSNRSLSRERNPQRRFPSYGRAPSSDAETRDAGNQRVRGRQWGSRTSLSRAQSRESLYSQNSYGSSRYSGISRASSTQSLCTRMSLYYDDDVQMDNEYTFQEGVMVNHSTFDRSDNTMVFMILWMLKTHRFVKVKSIQPIEMFSRGTVLKFSVGDRYNCKLTKFDDLILDDLKINLTYSNKLVAITTCVLDHTDPVHACPVYRSEHFGFVEDNHQKTKAQKKLLCELRQIGDQWKISTVLMEIKDEVKNERRNDEDIALELFAKFFKNEDFEKNLQNSYQPFFRAFQQFLARKDLLSPE